MEGGISETVGSDLGPRIDLVAFVGSLVGFRAAVGIQRTIDRSHQLPNWDSSFIQRAALACGGGSFLSSESVFIIIDNES